MTIDKALSGHTNLESIQWMLLSATTRRAFRGQLRALLSAPATLGPCPLRRARFKPERKLRAYYDARIRIEGTDVFCVRPITVTWRSDGDADRRHGRDDLAEIQAEALRRGVAAPFGQLTAELPKWRMQLQVSPLDARFPQLVRLSDPRHVGEMLAAAYAASGLASDHPRPDGYAITSIRYAPGSRHVLRYDPLDSAKGGTVFAKLYTGEKGISAFRVARRVADWLSGHAEGVACRQPLAYVAKDGVVLYPPVLSAPLSERLRRPCQEVGQCLERAGAALNALHDLPQEVAGPLEFHDFAAEVQEVARASKHIPVLLPPVGAAINALLDRAREVHERLPQEPPTFTHGDFKSDHVWGTPGRLAFIDFDNCRLADPALDVGKLLADLQFWYAAYHQPGVERAQDRFLTGYAADAPSERLVRAHLYEVVEVIKMAVRRVPLFDHDWASRTKQLMRRAQAVLNDLELTLGLPGWRANRKQHVAISGRRGSSSMNIADALSGRAKLEGIQWTLRSGAPRRALRRELSALLAAPDMLGPCHLRYARFGPGRKLRARYDALVHTEGTAKYSARPVAVTWSLDGDAHSSQAGDDLAEIQAEAVRRGVAAPFRQLTADLPEWSMHIQVWPFDARIPQLARLSDPRYASEVVAAACAASEVAPPNQVPASQYVVTSIRYLPGKRHVLRYDPLNSAKGGRVFAKLYPGEEGARVFHLASRAGEWLAQHGEGVTFVRPLAYVAEDGVVLYPGVVGTPLSDYLWRPTRGLARCLERTGAALYTLHHLPQAVVAPIQHHDGAAEFGKIAQASQYISALLPSVGAAIEMLLDRAREVHERLPQEPPTFAYGELKAEHVWVTRSGLTLIDLDTCQLADPALDIGNFLADQQYLYTAYDWPGLEQAQERFLAGYAHGAPSERLARARLFEAVELVRMTVRRVRRFDRNWGARTERLIRRAWTVMNDLQRALGLPASQHSIRGSQKRHHTHFQWRRQPSNKGAQI